jgi:hypothetical protein
MLGGLFFVYSFSAPTGALPSLLIFRFHGKFREGAFEARLCGTNCASLFALIVRKAGKR